MLPDPIESMYGLEVVKSGTISKSLGFLPIRFGSYTLATLILLHLTDADAYTAAFQDYQGATSIGLAARSVTYSIDNIDTDFDVIEHIVVIWDYKDVPNIYKFDEEFIPESGSLTVTHVGNEDYIQIDPLVFNQLSFGPEICKSITYKDNRLIAANIRTERYDINFDSRAYRFNGSNVSNLYNSTNQLEYTINYNGGTYTVPQLLGDWEDIPETADAINPFNNEDLVSNADWATNDQYKYIANTTTLGGNGPNISYQFQTNSFQSDDTFSSSSLSVSPPHISVNRYATGSTASIHDTTVDLSNTFKNFKSPLVDAYFTGYARGEMYRFGIVFYSNKGVPSFVKWIGDIKFPEANEIGYEVGNAGTLKSLGIKFTIDISSVQEEVSGFEIVRVKRTESNRTRLGTGTVLSFILSNGANSLAGITSWHRYASAAAHAGATGDNKTTNVEIDGTVKHCFCLADRPMDGYWAGSSIGDTNRMLDFLSPITQFTTISNFSPKDRDYIKDMGYYTSTIGVYDVDANNSYAFQLKGRNRENVTIPLKYRVDTTKLVDTGGLASDSEIDSINNGSPLSGNPYVLNASHAVDVAAAANSFYPLGVGERCMIMTIYQNPTDVNFSDSSNLNWSGHNPEAQFSFAAPLGEGNYATVTGANNIYWKEIVYCRFISNQYGGNSYADRSKNEYISTGAFTRVDNNSDLSQETIVFGGDVWVNYWDTEYLQYYDSNVDHYKADTTRHVGCATALPVEIPFNIELRRDNHWAADGDGTNMASYMYTEYNYNNVYTQENNARQVYIPKDFLLVENIEHSHRIWASEPKIDGELIDNWRIFKANEWIEVEGIHGQINTIINFRDRVLFYQDNALGIAQINEKATVQNTSGNNPEIVLGTGGVLVDFDYLSTETGSKHQFGVVKSGSRVYHYDANKKKFFALTQNAAQPLSDLKGLSAFFDHEIDFTLLESDLTLDETAEASGVHGVYDSRFNRVLYTFEGAKNYAFTANTQYDEGDIIFYSGSYWSFNEDYTSPNNISGLKIDDLLTELPNFKNAFTISYNEFIDAFESFYGYTPKIYLSSKRWVLSSDPDNPNKVYMHHRGEYGQYYENPAEDSVIEFIVNPEPNVTKIFNNIEWHSEVYDTNENDVYNETFTTLNVNNEYQDTGDITLVPGTNIKRRMRRWRLKIPRHKGTKARIRNPFTTIKFNIDNAPNRRVIINDVITYYTSASM